MMNSKVTYVDALSFVLSNCEMPAEISEKLNVLKDSIVRRNSADRKPTAKQRANAELNANIGDSIIGILSESENAMTVKELCEALGGQYSTQKVSAVLKALGSAVERSVEKRTAYYKIAG